MTLPYQFEITVAPEYLEEQSDAEATQFIFAYHIKIRNIGRKSAKLLRRHWVITDADNKVEEIHGDGVVGEQPLISPSGEHEYSSFCVLDTPLGCMHGSYHMLGEDGHEFIANIPIFTLAKKGILH
ncbi:MAG: Co2+/Mg2+ efflux protein ApaG [Mariprofundaceae bacterium]|nr:Co2+/Mg2+ efflux protein ApaG [Mariprofundaceae bacterium]